MRPVILRNDRPPVGRGAARDGGGARFERAEPKLTHGHAAPSGAGMAAPGTTAAGSAPHAPGATPMDAAAKKTARKSPRPGARRRDPAPSRIGYKIHRLWLTPGFRLFMRAGLPMLLVFAATYAWLVEPERRQMFLAAVTELTRAVKSRPEFMVELMAIEGASPATAQLIRSEFPLNLPISSFDLDLEVMQAEIAELDAVDSASLRLRPGGVLEVTIVEKQPVAVWRSRDGLMLVDMNGDRVADLDRRQARPDLPLIAGEGAQDQVPEALDILRVARPIAGDLRGLVRIGRRRWDLVLTGDRRIKLPEDDPVPALQQVLALNQAQELLDRAILTVDMRNPLRPTLRLAPEAQAEMRRIKAIQTGDLP